MSFHKNCGVLVLLTWMKQSLAKRVANHCRHRVGDVSGWCGPSERRNKWKVPTEKVDLAVDLGTRAQFPVNSWSSLEAEMCRHWEKGDAGGNSFHVPFVWMAKDALAAVLSLFDVIIWSRTAHPWNRMYGSTKGPGFFTALTDPGLNVCLTGV